MEQLLSMGFPEELATQALAATGGKSTVKATEWILSHSHKSSSSNPNPSPGPSPSLTPPPFQPKLDRFFQSKQPLHPHSNHQQPPLLNPDAKRLKLTPSPSDKNKKKKPPHEPLSERMRPCNIDDIVGQDHLLGKNSLLRSSLGCDCLPSIVLWGPPGTGKTSIAKAIANSAVSSYQFISLSAVTSGVKDVREAVEEARKFKKQNKRTVLFVDEVHRFNKSQQDSFLPVIEDGSVVFVGATTENPSFHLITPLLSRCRVLKLNPLQPDTIASLLRRAVRNVEKGVNKSVGIDVTVKEEVVEFLSLHCDGDARVALNALEISSTTAAARVRNDHTNDTLSTTDGENGGVGSLVAVVNLDDAKEALQCKHLAYDRAGEEHYNLISALHKSMRGSDADASIYWLARMLEGGEQPLYIARRLIRFASEDVGLADPSAITQAVACYQACHFIGMPECNVNLAQCVAYLALAPKSIAVYKAIGLAQEAVKESVGQNEGVPLHLRNAPTKLMKEFDYGKGYIYTPADPSASQTFLPPSLQGHKFLNWPPKEHRQSNSKMDPRNAYRERFDSTFDRRSLVRSSIEEKKCLFEMLRGIVLGTLVEKVRVLKVNPLQLDTTVSLLRRAVGYVEKGLSKSVGIKDARIWTRASCRT